MELAQGRVPDRRLRIREQLGQTRTLREEALVWLAGRVDLAESTRESYERIIQRNAGARLGLWEQRPRSITPEDVQRFIAELSAAGAAPRTVPRNVAVIAQVLDHVGVEPNPARHRSVKLPRFDAARPDPPTAREVTAIIQHAPRQHRLPIALLEATGMRVGELLALCWGDVSFAENRFRVAKGKTRSARRFVPVPEPLMELVHGLVPFDERRVDRRVFPTTREALDQAMRRACQAAGIPTYSPHDLRHRHASVRVLRGDPITVVQRDLGHARASLTLDTYATANADTDWGWPHAISTC